MTTGFTFRVEMTEGQSQRQVDADNFADDGDWLIFFRDGDEYWRANRSKVVSMETRCKPVSTDTEENR